LLGLCVLFYGLRRTARRRRKSREPAPLDRYVSTPCDGLVALSDTIRQDLTGRFGTSWRAKTTEELSADQELAQLLGPDLFPDLIRFLARVDRRKFAGARPPDEQDVLQQEVIAWEPRVALCREKIRAKGTARE
jgi:hypothetical protein